MGCVDDSLSNVQTNHFGWCDKQGFVDIHCHILAGLDDGPRTIDESLALCNRLSEEGITTVVATPHQLGRFEGCNDAISVRHAVWQLNNVLKNNATRLKVVPGGEVRVDERICDLLDADKVLTLADNGRYILLELPPGVFVDIEPLLDQLALKGIQAIISHPEKNSILATQPRLLHKWFDYCCHLQITASSLMGDLGPQVRLAALDFIKAGWASLVATDVHRIDISKPRMKDAFEHISQVFDTDTANLLFRENPLRVVNGQSILYAQRQNKQEAM